MRSEFSMAVTMKIDAFRVALPCCLVELCCVSRENIACTIRAVAVSKTVTTPTVNAGIYAYQRTYHRPMNQRAWKEKFLGKPRKGWLDDVENGY
jgi:hypothetical protein